MIFTFLHKKWANPFYVYSKKTFCLYQVLLTDSLKSKNIDPNNIGFRLKQTENLRSKESVRNYVVAAGILGLGLTFASVPLYRIFCQATGFGGTSKTDVGGEKIVNLRKVPYRQIKVKFTSDVGTNLQWKFKPQQSEITVIPGETALAFYTAINPLDKPVVGISSYNILPYEAATYFNKIQCFCFEEQMLNPKEQVDMPVFFYIDPEFCEDPLMENIDEIILSYTFFAVKDQTSIQNLFNRSTE